MGKQIGAGSRLLGTAIVLLLLSQGCCGPVTSLYPPKPDQPAKTVYVYNNHWHTGFVLAVDDLPPAARKLLSRFAHDEFVEIGWGDEGFYRAPHATSGLALRAAFFSSGSVLHIVAVNPTPAVFYSVYDVDLYRLRLTSAGYQRLIDNLCATFRTDGAGQAIDLGPGLYGDSRFYKARGHYSLFHTCNHWTADMLRAAGFPITPVYAGIADILGWQITAFGRKYQSDIRVALR